MTKTTPVLLKPGTPLPPGAIRIHFGNPETALAPRGSMAKNSLGETIFERLKSSYENWTDTKYADNPNPTALANSLHDQAKAELQAALDKFAADVHDFDGECED